MDEHDKRGIWQAFQLACYCADPNDQREARDQISDEAEQRDLTVDELLEVAGLDREMYWASRPAPVAQRITR